MEGEEDKGLSQNSQMSEPKNQTGHGRGKGRGGEGEEGRQAHDKEPAPFYLARQRGTRGLMSHKATTLIPLSGKSIITHDRCLKEGVLAWNGISF